MNELENDDELLLLELERRDGIYSFIFHEMEDHQQQKQKELKEEQTLVETNLIENTDNIKLSKVERKFDVIMPSTTTPPATNKSQTTACLFANEISKPLAYAGHNTKTLNATDVWKTWQPNAVSTNSQILPFNFQFQMPARTYGSFKNSSMTKPWGVRKAKPSFSHVSAPLVRNRRHKLKETAEYKSFEENLTKVADLRQLFPLDPDVYAPFLKTKVEETKSSKSCGVIVENINYLK